VPSLTALRAAATEHLFLAWLTHARGPIADAISAAGLTPDGFRAILAKSRKGRRRRGPQGADEGGLTSHATRVISTATERATAAGRDEPNTEDLILAMVQEPRGPIARALTEFDIKPSRLKALASDRPAPPRTREPASAAVAPPASPTPRAERPPRERPARREPPPREARVEPPAPQPVTPPPPGGPPIPDLDVRPGRRISWLTPLYLAIPAAIWLAVQHADPTLVFVVACLGVLPLAGLMGEATEQLAERTGPTLGGLLNATFGNAAELIIAVAALRAGLIDLVKASIAGSILGNLLLILGLSLLAGGTRKSMLRFNRTSAGMSAAMLALAVGAMIFPTLFHLTHPGALTDTELRFSEAVSAVLIVTYLLSLVFVLRTHRPLFGGGHLEGVHLSGVWPVWKGLAYLTVATIGVAVMSEILVHAVGPMTAELGISEVFLGLIIIPVIGNAAEHGTAVVAARHGHTDLALQISLGSSTQIALLVAPALVFVGAFMGYPGMNLVFSSFEVLGLSVAVIITAIITLDGESHWFEGVQLLALYTILAAAAWFI
jgi:Ca2+:H+ antiporter